MNSISSRMLAWIGGTAATLFVIGLLITQTVQRGLYESAVANQKMESIDYFNGRIAEKLAAGLGASVAITYNPDLIFAVFDKDHEGLTTILKKIAQQYADKTEYKNIQFLVIDSDGNFLLRTYAKEPDAGRGKDATYRAGVKEILSGKVNGFTGVDLSSGGLVLSSMTPVMMKDRRVGVLEFRSGWGTINDELLNRNFYHVALLNDKATERFKAGKDNKKIGSFYLAHNKQFRDAAQQWYEKLPVDAIIEKGYWEDDQRVISIMPIMESDGNVIGYHLIGFDKTMLAGRFAELDKIAHILEAVMLVLVLGIMLVVWWSIRRQVSKPVADMQRQLNAVRQSGRFDQKLVIIRDDEMGQMAQGVNGLLTMLSESIGGVNGVLAKVAEGDFRQRIEANLPGDLGMLKDSLNHAVSALQGNMIGLSHAMEALGRGQLDYRMPTTVEAKMRAQVDGALHTLQTTISQINSSMDAVAAGDFTQLITLDAEGDFALLKDSVNHSISELRSAMDELVVVAGAMSQGDLTVKVRGQYQGELKLIADAFNGGLGSIHDSLSDIARAVSMVAQAAGEVATGNTDLSNRTQTQAASLERTSSAMEQMTAAILQTADSAQLARSLAQNTAQAAVTGVGLMDQTVGAMREIGQANQRITDIVGLIDSIAFQTNLLALNAAVEAARAGEHGRGFAVVASEVRSLAQKAADAAKDIKGLIEQTVGKIQAGDRLVGQTVEAFAEIQNRLSETDTSISAIAQAMSEQRVGVEQVNRSVTELDESTQQNAALVEETSASAETMRGQAQEVQARISRFTLSGVVTQAAPVQQRAVPAAAALPKPKAPVHAVKALPAAKASGADEWNEF